MSYFLLFLSMLNAVNLAASFLFLRSVCTGRKFSECISRSVFSGRPAAAFLSATAFLVSLHLFVPLTGLALTLRTDYNFLPVLAGILISMQISQRLQTVRNAKQDDGDLSSG